MRLHDSHFGSFAAHATVVFGAALALWCGPPPAAAQGTATASALEEIVVTARKKAESLQRTPITMTAITAEDIQARNFASITDIGSFTPNVSLSAGSTDVGGAANAVFFIRGIGQLDYAPTSDPGLGVYIDGVYLGRSQGAVMELADIQQIEVLKGPQGTLFGKNTMGGAINITTRDPGDEFGGSAAITAGEDERINFDGQLDVPFSDTAGGHFAVSYHSQDGFQERPFAGDDSGEEGTLVSRAKLVWTPNEKTRIVASGDYTRINADANTVWITENQNTLAGPPNLVAIWNGLVGFPAGTPYTSAITSTDPRVNNSDAPMKLEFEGGGASLKLEWDLDAFLLRSISAYRTLDSRNQRDMDGSPANFGHVDYRDEQWQFSQEFNLIGTAFADRLDWTVGAYYFKEDAQSNWIVGLADGLYPALEALPGPFFPLAPGVACPPPPGVPLPCAGGAGNPFNLALELVDLYTPELQTDSYAVFGEFEWHFTDRLSAITGVRYSHDEKDFRFSNRGVLSGVVDPGFPVEASDSWSDVSPRFGLKFQATDDVLLYATVSKGYKAGSYTARPQDAASAVLSFDPEELWAYEGGFKSDLLERRLRLNGAVFYYDYTDLQQTTNQVPPGGAGPVQYTDNIGAATIWGIEADLTFLATERLTLYGSVGYLDAQYDEASAILTGVGLDTPLVKAPEWSATASAQYFQPLSFGELLYRVDYSYVDENFPDARATPQLRQKAHSLVNTRVAWTSVDDSWTVAFYGKNVFDEKYVANGFDVSAFVGYFLGVPSDPRELGVQILRRF
ncbi:MAG: TonB-dependent receptor [Gammaproteobacteria bacterium]|nr:TonB-dependent receptor [Gammaproteobacteria bacterium]